VVKHKKLNHKGTQRITQSTQRQILICKINSPLAHIRIFYSFASIIGSSKHWDIGLFLMPKDPLKKLINKQGFKIHFQ